MAPRVIRHLLNQGRLTYQLHRLHHMAAHIDVRAQLQALLQRMAAIAHDKALRRAAQPQPET
ncbi:hypothetical protein [Edwardsiella ictaluri]|uniref:hypothetical protein n=1 Tax=Edwardsiella ictaluri TaxID=67780 RepID=UPI000E1BBF5A|nr:hypothetical protein [Edwardsiella ictaluri]